jgi:hypothetical protein
MTQPPADDLAARLARGVQLLRAGRPRDAAGDLEVVARSPELAAEAELMDIRARALSLYAQALLESGRPAEADAPCREALGLLRRLRDREGVDEVRALQDRVVRAITEAKDATSRLEEARRVAELPIEALLSEAASPGERAAVLVRKAQALADAGREEEAADLAFAGLDVARAHAEVTWEVFARLVLARVEPGLAEQQIHAAHAAAVAADELNLVSTIAHTASTLGVAMPVEPGPHLGHDGQEEAR